MSAPQRKLAIWTHGGVGGGLFGQGFPMIVQILERLAPHLDVTVFSTATIPDDFIKNGYRTFSPAVSMKRWQRWPYMILVFLRQHFKNRYDVLYSFWGYPTGTVIVFLGKLLNVPSIVNILGSETVDIPELNYGYLRKETRGRMLWTLRNASEVIAVSQYQIEKLKEKNFSRKIVLIPWGVDVAQFYPVTKDPAPPLRILHVANLNKIKDQETLIRAFAIIQKEIPAMLRIVGADYLEGSIQKFVAEMQLDNVEFTGAIPHKDIAAQYHWADVFMLTSVSEGQNNSITEAMACGLLPAGTAVGIMHDIGKTVGVAVAVSDYKTMALELIRLYYTPEAWRKKREAALLWTQHHTLDWTCTELLKIIQHV
jgi:glycosyltransferase involved in cell wall biosynthesis